MSIIELKGVTKEYGQGHTLVQALKPTDFRLEAGQFVAIIGPSGSGKTTLLTLLGHLQTQYGTACQNAGSCKTAKCQCFLR